MDLYSIKSNGERFFPTHKVNYYIAVGIIPVIDDVRLAARSKSGLCLHLMLWRWAVAPERGYLDWAFHPKRHLRCWCNDSFIAITLLSAFSGFSKETRTAIMPELTEHCKHFLIILLPWILALQNGTSHARLLLT